MACSSGHQSWLHKIRCIESYTTPFLSAKAITILKGTEHVLRALEIVVGSGEVISKPVACGKENVPAQEVVGANLRSEFALFRIALRQPGAVGHARVIVRAARLLHLGLVELLLLLPALIHRLQAPLHAAT